MSRRNFRKRRTGADRSAGFNGNPFLPPRPDRKMLQLCAQVKEALGWVLGSANDDETLGQCAVQSVEPLPGGNRMIVRIEVPPEIGLADVTERLVAAAKPLRTEVAQSITRRKAPELVYLAVRGGA